MSAQSTEEQRRLQQAIADLKGLLSGPPLLTTQSLEEGWATLKGAPPLMPEIQLVDEARLSAWRATLDDPSCVETLELALARELSQLKGRRIGLYAERLLIALFQALPEERLLSHDLQFYSEEPQRQTIGALDFLLAGPLGVEHLELTVKFYLQLPGRQDWGAWLGPNERDTMAIKGLKLFGHQLPLSRRADVQRQLRAMGLPCPRSWSALCLGRCFQPLEPLEPPEPLDQHRSVWVRRGRWAELHQEHRKTLKRWVPRLYPDWLHRAPELFALREPLSAEEVERLPLERGRYLMLTELTATGEEARRWMLVSDDWGR